MAIDKKNPPLAKEPDQATSTSRKRVPRSIQRKHLDERLRSLQHRIQMLEGELIQLESRFYRVCIFGSARIQPATEIYLQVVTLAKLLSSKGIDILTGGGPGLMEAANYGAQLGRKEGDTKSRSYGLSIELEWEPIPNQHLDIKRHHHKFSSRLDDFMRLSHSVICTPGGIGTLLELLFCWQLIQVKHIETRPIVLLDGTFWVGLLDWMKSTPLTRGLISEKDFNAIQIVDTPEEAFEIITRHHSEFIANRAVALDINEQK